MKWLLLLAVFIWLLLFLRKKCPFKFGLSPIELEIKPIKGLKKLTDQLEILSERALTTNIRGGLQ